MNPGGKEVIVDGVWMSQSRSPVAYPGKQYGISARQHAVYKHARQKCERDRAFITLTTLLDLLNLQGLDFLPKLACFLSCICQEAAIAIVADEVLPNEGGNINLGGLRDSRAVVRQGSEARRAILMHALDGFLEHPARRYKRARA